MAKRFTDTEKWKKRFLRQLPPNYKLLWLFIVDECNPAGIWEVDIDVAQLKMGVKLKESDALKHFKDKIVLIDSGTKWFIPQFIEFQYGELRDNNKPHISIIKTLERYGVANLIQVGYNTPINNNIKGSKRLEIFKRDNYTCTYCGVKFEVTNLEPDHIIPLNKCGGNDFDNIVTSCKTCNRKKSDLDLDFFIEKFSLKKEEIEQRIETSRGIHTPWDTPKDMDKDKEGDMEMEEDKDKGGLKVFQNPNLIYPYESEKFLTAWGAWIAYKQTQFKFKFKSDETEQAALKQLSELSAGHEPNAIAIIQQSMANGWKGLFDLKITNNGNSKNQSGANGATGSQSALNKLDEMYSPNRGGNGFSDSPTG